MNSLDLSKVIEAELEDYVEDVTEVMRQAVTETTDQAVETLKVTSPKRRGKYAKGWASKVLEDSPTGLVKTVHNRTAGLTHLLENGHAKVGGGRVECIPHIAPVEAEVIRDLEKRLEDRL